MKREALLNTALMVVLLEKERALKEKLGDALRLSLLAALMIFPWLIRNAAWTGNPLYPLMFPAGAMTAPRLVTFQGVPPWRGWSDVVILPWQATMLGIEDKEGFSASIGALLLALSPFAAFSSQRKRLFSAAALTATSMAIWLVGSRLSFLLIQSRLYLAFFPAWALLAGAGYDFVLQMELPGLRVGKIASALIALPLIFTTLTGLEQFYQRDTAGYWLGKVSAADYRARSLGAYPAAMEAVNALPAGSRVLFLWETRGLDCLPICDPDETIDNWYAARHTFGAADAILTAWRDNGYTHILVFNNGVNFIRNDLTSRLVVTDWQEFERLLTSLRLEKDIGGMYALYALH